MAIETEFVFLQPADVLVVRTTAYMHQEQRAHIVAGIKAQLGAGAKVIVLDGGLDLQVLRPAGVATDKLTVRLDASDMQKAISEVLEPGAVLLSAEAVRRIAEKTGASAEAIARDLIDVGGVAAPRAQEGPAEASEPAVLPAYTWVDKASLVGDQASFAISHDEKNDCYAILDENLTEGQRVTLGVAL